MTTIGEFTRQFFSDPPERDLFGDEPAPALPVYGANDGMPLCRCGSAAFAVGPGVGPHHAKARCIHCGTMRWLPKTWRAPE